MKSKILWLLIFPLVLLSALVSCDQEGYKGRYVLELDKDSVTIDVKGKGEDVYVRSNGDWKIEDMPEWLHVSPDRGPYSTHIAIGADPNKETNERKATLVFTYGNGSKTLEVVQLRSEKEEPEEKDILRFDTYSVLASVSGSVEEVSLFSDHAWKVTSAPTWISVTPSEGTFSAKLAIKVEENRDPERRDGIIVFEASGIKKELKVTQPGLKDISQAPLSYVFSFKGISYSADWKVCEVEVNQLFVNPSIHDKIYLGNLLEPITQSHTNVSEFEGYTFNPVTVSVSAEDGITKTYLPSLSEQDAFAKQVIENPKAMNPSLKVDTFGVNYYSHRYLHGIGLVNFGLKLDEVLFGHSFKQEEMKRKYGLVMFFKQTLFTLAMKTPEKLVKEDLKEADKAKGVSYISKMNYGKVGALVMESDVDFREVKAVVLKALRSEALSAEEANLLTDTDIYYVYFDNNRKVQVLQGSQNAIVAYKEAMETVSDNVYPLEFQLADYTTHHVTPISFSVTLPQ